MAAGNVDPVRAVGRKRSLLAGTFFPNGAGTIDNTKNLGSTGWTVARTATGVYTITLTDAWLRLVGKSNSLQLSAIATRILQWGAIDVSTNKTLVLNVFDSTPTAQDIASNASNSISFELILSQDTVTP